MKRAGAQGSQPAQRSRLPEGPGVGMQSAVPSVPSGGSWPQGGYKMFPTVRGPAKGL